jgi:hypothetical protein
MTVLLATTILSGYGAVYVPKMGEYTLHYAEIGREKSIRAGSVLTLPATDLPLCGVLPPDLDIEYVKVDQPEQQGLRITLKRKTKRSNQVDLSKMTRMRANSDAFHVLPIGFRVDFFETTPQSIQVPEGVALKQKRTDYEFQFANGFKLFSFACERCKANSKS